MLSGHEPLILIILFTIGCLQSIKESGQRVAFTNFSALKRNTNYLASFLNFIIVNCHNPSAVVCIKLTPFAGKFH